MRSLYTFKDVVPKDINNICLKLWDNGINATVVGGIVRDFFHGSDKLK